MDEDGKMALNLLSTGVPGLDEVFGGGLPEYSFNLVAGEPGAGKTTLVHQIVFANASAERPALYFTVLGEPAIKMLRYQQQMAFFDPDKVGDVIRFIDLGNEVLEGDLDRVLQAIVEHVKEANPGIVVIDSFRTVAGARRHTEAGERDLQDFLQRLALYLASWQATSFLVGEYGESERHANPVFTIADGIFWLTQCKERNAMVRKLEVMKMRGRATLPGLHTFRISSQGVKIFPRSQAPLEVGKARFVSRARASSGVPGFDALLGGGLPAGDATLVAGPSGTGKTVLSTQFIAEGVAHGEPGLLAIFEEQPDDYLARALSMGIDLRAMIDDGMLRVIYLRPIDLSADEILHRVHEAANELHAKRLVIDSLNGVELALAPSFREDFRESLYRMLGSLTGAGVSVLLTMEIAEAFDQIRFSTHAVSFLAQNILFFRYVEIEGALKKVLAVIKMRRSGHSTAFHKYEITDRGMRILGPIPEYQGLLTGTPSLREDADRGTPGLTEREDTLLRHLQGVEETTEDALSTAVGLPSAELARALERLVELNYVIRSVEDEQTLYRSVVRPLGGR